MSLQDITTILAVFVATISAYALGYAHGLADYMGPVGFTLMLPNGLYDASALIPKAGYFPVAVMMISALHYYIGQNLGERDIAKMVAHFGAAALSFAPIYYFHHNTSQVLDTWIMANLAAGALYLIVEERHTGFKVGLYILTFFVAIFAKGSFDSEANTIALLNEPAKYTIETTEGTLTSVHIIRATPSGYLISVQRNMTFYPTDQIKSIAYHR